MLFCFPVLNKVRPNLPGRNLVPSVRDYTHLVRCCRCRQHPAMSWMGSQNESGTAAKSPTSYVVRGPSGMRVSGSVEAGSLPTKMVPDGSAMNRVDMDMKVAIHHVLRPLKRVLPEHTKTCMPTAYTAVHRFFSSKHN